MCIRDSFSGVQCEAEISQVVNEDKRSSLGHLGDNGSANGQIGFLCVSGTARWGYNKVVLPSVWIENVRLDWESDNNERNRVIEIFKLNRGYKGLNNERIIIKNGDLPFSTCVVSKEDCIESDNNKHLPVVRLVYL